MISVFSRNWAQLSLLLVLVFFSSSTFAQETFTISGYIKDADSGEDLIGAYIYDFNDKGKGTSTNLYGFYSVSLPTGSYTMEVSYIGYQSLRFEVNLDEDISFDVELPQESFTSTEVVVTSERKDKNVQSTEMSTVNLQVEKIKVLPAFMGEVDILKTIQLLPGVQSAGEGNAGFYVRGGGPDQNLILLDDAVVYNSGHMFGFFSVFNADAIKNSKLIKGGMPAQYGGRLSSVLDVNMKEGNNRRFQVDGGIGLIASRLTLQGPIVKEKASFIVSGRRTYVMDLAQPYLNSTDFKGTNYYFYDLNAKVNYQLGKKDRVYMSGYFGRDVLTYASAERGFNLSIPWGNSTFTARWNHLFNDKLFMNATALYNDYQFEFNGQQDETVFSVFSGIKDWSFKTDFDYFPNLDHTIKFGTNYTYHQFTPNNFQGQAGDAVFDPALNRKYAHEAAIYVQDDFEVTSKLKIHIGLRASMFSFIGPWDQVTGSGSETDTIKWASGEVIKTHTGLEPRFNFRYQIDNRSSVKGSVVLTNQYMHLVSNSTSTLPTDIWVPSSQLVKPQRGLQYALGYFRNFDDDNWEASVEVYYRNMINQIDYAESYVLELGSELENSFVFGTGRAYGAEFFLKKNFGKLNGWVGYTLARTDRLFDDVNDGGRYAAKYDRTHDLSVAVDYKLNDKWNFGGIFVYGSGNTYTLPESVYLVGDYVAVDYGVRNAARVRAYHRMDLSATWTPNPDKKKGMQSTWNFSIYNVYNRKNPLFLYADSEVDSEAAKVTNSLIEVSIFPIIPSVTWNFSF